MYSYISDLAASEGNGPAWHCPQNLVLDGTAKASKCHAAATESLFWELRFVRLSVIVSAIFKHSFVWIPACHVEAKLRNDCSVAFGLDKNASKSVSAYIPDE